MCIFVASTKHRDFPFVLLDNRDEYYERPTAAANWWETNGNIYAPQDLQREERGTWIGVSRKGRAAALVNYFEDAPKFSRISRGLLTRRYLESDLSPKAWVEAIRAEHREELENSGGFTLLVAQYVPAGSSTSSPEPRVEVEFLTNEPTELPDLKTDSSVSLSNGSISDSTWTKTAQATTLAHSLYTLSDASSLTETAFELLSTPGAVALKSRFDVRHHIFVNPFPNGEGGKSYGTRTQTVILFDKSGNIIYTEKDVLTGTQKREFIKFEAD